MEFQDNFSEEHLLFGQDVEFIDENNKKIFAMRLPKFKHCMFDYRFQKFLSFMATPLSDFNKILGDGVQIKSYYELLCILLMRQDIAHNIIEYSFKIMFDFAIVKDNNLYIQDIGIDEKLFNRILYIITTATGQKTMSQAALIDERTAAMEAKINAIRNKNKSKEQRDSFISSYIILTYEFHYSQDEILNMTFYAINKILKYTSNSINYKISLIAAGNGLSKKINFIIGKDKHE